MGRLEKDGSWQKIGIGNEFSPKRWRVNKEKALRRKIMYEKDEKEKLDKRREKEDNEEEKKRKENEKEK